MKPCTIVFAVLFVVLAGMSFALDGDATEKSADPCATASEEFSEGADNLFAEIKKYLLCGIRNHFSTTHSGGGMRTMGKNFYSATFYDEPRDYIQQVRESSEAGDGCEGVISVPVKGHAQAVQMKGSCKNLTLEECFAAGGTVKKIISDFPVPVDLDFVFIYKSGEWEFQHVVGDVYDRFQETEFSKRGQESKE